MMHKLVSLSPGEPALAPLHSLLDVQGTIFESHRPQQIRARLFHYDFTSSEIKGRTAFGDGSATKGQAVQKGKWWSRVQAQEVFVPSFGANATSVLSFLRHHGWSVPPREPGATPPCGEREELALAAWDGRTPKRPRQQWWWQPARIVASKLAMPLCGLARLGAMIAS